MLSITGCPLTNLNVSNCKELKTLRLDKNKELTTLNANNSGLTSLDLSQNKELTTLEIVGCSLGEINIENNTLLKKVDVSLNKNGEGLKDKVFLSFIDKLPNRVGKEQGRISVSTEQFKRLPKNGFFLRQKGWEFGQIN